jgi:hypothetical protein
MLARRQIRLAALAALQGAALGAFIYTPGNLTSQPEKLPAVLLRAARGGKEPFTAASCDYTSTVQLEIESRVAGYSGEEAQDGIDALDAAIEQALLTNSAFTGLTQRIHVDVETEITAEGRLNFGATKWLLRCELVEVFDPVFGVPASVPPVAVPLDGIDLHVDLAGTFDANGTYPMPGPFIYPVAPAPRNSGPDGRDEGALTIDLPQ